jgi:histidine triad (HIT) family protein
MNECVFCKIIKKEIPCYKIYENEHTIAFLDRNPIVQGHTLVIPKTHSVNVLDTEDFYLSEVLKTVKRISNHYINKGLATGVNILNASGKSAEQSVFHLHFHILPRKDDDNLKTFPETEYVKEDFNEILSKYKL